MYNNKKASQETPTIKIEQLEQGIQAAQDRLADLRQSQSLSSNAMTRSGNCEAKVQSAVREVDLSLEELSVAVEALYTQQSEISGYQEALSHERQRYQDLFNFAPDCYFVTDLQGMIQEANQAAATLFNVAQKFLIGKPISIYVAEHDRSKFRVQLSQLSALQHCTDWEIDFQPRDQDVFPALFSVSSIAFQDVDISLRWMVRNVSAQKQLEARLMQANQQLEAQVQERTAELLHTIKQLKATIAERDQAMQDRAEATLNLNQTQAINAAQASLLRTVIDKIPDWIYVKDAAFRYTLVNQSFAKSIGRSISEIIGKTDLEIGFSESVVFGDPDAEVCGFRIDDQAVLAGETIYNPRDLATAQDGSAIVFETTKLPLRNADQTVIGIVGISHDITDAAKREAERQQTDHHRDVRYTATRILLDSKQIEGVIPKVLQAICRGLNWQVGELWTLDSTPVLHCVECWNSPSANLDLFVEKTKSYRIECGKSLPGRVWESLQPVWITDVLNETNFLRSREASEAGLHTALGFPIVSNGNFIGVLALYCHAVQPPNVEMLTTIAMVGNQIGQFIKRKQAESALRESEAQLRQTVQELQRAQVQLVQQEKMSSLGQLVAGIAHEINNPVNFIVGNLEHTQGYFDALLHLIQLYQTHDDRSIAEIQDYIEDIDLGFLLQDVPNLLDSMRSGADRIVQIVNSLRTFSRLDEADFKAVNLRDGIESTLTILQHQLQAQHYRPAIQTNVNYGDLPLIHCYPGLMNQVFMHLLTNAIDAINDRAQSDQNATVSPLISIRLGLTIDQQVEIRLADNGVGIPETMQQQIFNPFFTTKAIGKGTGLGLSIAYQIITERHRGTIECFSKLNSGTEFVIRIPILDRCSIA